MKKSVGAVAGCILAIPLTGCGVLQRLAEDPSRVCPPGHQLVIKDGQPTCTRPRETPAPEPSPTPTIQPTRTPVCCEPTQTPTTSPTRTPEATLPPSTVTPTPPPTPENVREICLDPAGKTAYVFEGQLRYPPDYMVPPVTGGGCQWPLVRRDVTDPEQAQRMPTGTHICVANWQCRNPTDRPPLSGPPMDAHHYVDQIGRGYFITDGHPGPMNCPRLYTDAFARMTCDGQTFLDPGYNNPDDYFLRVGVCPPRACPESTPPPIEPAPNPGAVNPPTMLRWKVQNIDHHPNKALPGLFGCHNPMTEGKFLDQNVCEVGSTQGPYRANLGTKPGPDGPCDTDHPLTFNTVCGGRDWDDPRGPVWEIKDAEDLGPSEHDGKPNNHHRLIRFTSGRCFTVCTSPREDLQSRDGIRIPFSPGAKTCAEHCY